MQILAQLPFVQAAQSKQFEAHKLAEPETLLQSRLSALPFSGGRGIRARTEGWWDGAAGVVEQAEGTHIAET